MVKKKPQKAKKQSQVASEDDTHTPSDLGTPERAAMTLSTVSTTGEQKRRRRILVQVPLDYYYHLSRGGIDRRQWEAGNRLYEIFVATALYPSLSPTIGSISIPRISPERSRSAAQQAAYRQYNDIIAHLGEKRFGCKLVINVCCYGYRVGDLLTAPYTRADQLMARLKEELDTLADYLRIPQVYANKKSMDI